MLNSVRGWADTHKQAHQSHKAVFDEYKFTNPPKEPWLKLGGPKTRRWRAYQFYLANKPSVDPILQAWHDAIAAEQARLEQVVTMHGRLPDEREYKNSAERIDSARQAASKAIEELKRGYNKRRGKT